MSTRISSIVIIYSQGDSFIVDVAIEALAAKKQDIEVLGSPIILPDRNYSRRNNVSIGQGRCIVINARQLEESSSDDDDNSDEETDFDYEYLYSKKHFVRRDFVRFLAFIFGQSRPNDDIVAKSRSTFLSLTFPDISDALPNLPIVSVGVDALELRVDLFQEKDFTQAVPRLCYVAKQFLALRRRTELPIIFTIRFDDSGGKWPSSEDHIAQRYLRKALQWGVEYLDVATSFSEEIKSNLRSNKGTTLIMASHHDLNGGLDWTSPETDQLFNQCSEYGDIIQLVGIATCQKDNYDLERFRSSKRSNPAAPPLIAINAGLEGRFSRIMNPFLNPIKHNLLPRAASPSQLSLAEINRGLAILGEIRTATLYTFSFGSSCITPPPQFFEKCLNELSLPHLHTHSAIPSESTLTKTLGSLNFGGAVILPPVKATASMFASVSGAAKATGLVDTIVAKDGKLHGHNTVAMGIIRTLTRDFTPSAYANQCALVVSHSFAAAASAIYALQALRCRKVYTIGFTIPEKSPLTLIMQRCYSLSFEEDEAPFAVLSALAKDDIHLLSPLFQLLGSPNKPFRKFLDVANQSRQRWTKNNSQPWLFSDAEEVAAWTAVEMMKLLVGQNVPYDFVRMAGKEGFF